MIDNAVAEFSDAAAISDTVKQFRRTEDDVPSSGIHEAVWRTDANAIVESINTKAAKLVPGVVDIYTWEDVPQNRFTIAGQTFPEPSPYDRLIIDRHVRFSGDVVAIIAAETEAAALKAMKLIKVKYEVLDAVLDFRTAKDNPVLVHQVYKTSCYHHSLCP